MRSQTLAWALGAETYLGLWVFAFGEFHGSINFNLPRTIPIPT